VPPSSKSTSPSPSMTSFSLLFLGIPSPRRLGVVRELPRIVVKSREVCIALLFMGIDSKNRVGIGGNLGRIRVERDPALCELINEDVGNLCGWPNFRNKYCISLCLLYLLSATCFVFFVFLSSRPRVSYSSPF
jgi:hypothetical protein